MSEVPEQQPGGSMSQELLDRVLDCVSLLEASDGDEVNQVVSVIEQSYAGKRELVELLVVMTGMTQGAITSLANSFGVPPSMILSEIRNRALQVWSSGQ